ncbi:MAG: hypothetical protein QOH06_1569 [Acidobacteriota bacterium]|jgi:HEAT repeat protein|nr:hypothetical protein [Acidobacteriota bacterium]
MWKIFSTLAIFGGILHKAIFGAPGGDKSPPQVWQEAAESCGLQVVEAATSLLKARAGAVEVRIEVSQETSQTRIVVEPALPDFGHMMIRPEPLLQFDQEIEIGDAHFDTTFLVIGPTRLVFALLDAEVRRLLLAVNAAGRLELSYGELQVALSDEKVPEVLPLLLEIGRRFLPPLNIPQRLAGNAGKDPEAGVRFKNLLLLVREFPNHPETAEALRKACSDPSPEIRLRAAKEMGAEGRGILLELAANLEDDAVSAEAVSTLGRELPFERTRAILGQALSLYHVRTARACLEALGHSGAATAVNALVEVLALENIELAIAAAQALGATESPAAEPSLISALHREQVDLRVAAADALGRVGSVAAVPPLKEAAESSRLDLKLRRAARQAIAEIKSRVQGASPGQLSLAGAEAGQLSLTEAEAGQLSLATDPAGQLSLSSDEEAVP